MIEIYTDGACLNNNSSSAERKAGIGVFFSDNNPLNLSEPMPDSLKPFTNNRAEIYACIRALQQCKQANLFTNNITIYSDSIIVINTMTGKFKKKSNRELWNMLDDLCADFIITWVKVPGHSNNYGNNMADKLARDGIFK